MSHSEVHDPILNAPFDEPAAHWPIIDGGPAGAAFEVEACHGFGVLGEAV